MNTLLSSFKRTDPVKVVGYTDDILLYVCGSDESTMGNLMEAALERVKTWGAANGLVFNPSKTTIVNFERSRRTKHKPPVRIGGTVLEYSEDLQYLGVNLNKRPSIRNHAWVRGQEIQIPITQGQKHDRPGVGLDPVQTHLDPNGHH